MHFCRRIFSKIRCFQAVYPNHSSYDCSLYHHPICHHEGSLTCYFYQCCIFEYGYQFKCWKFQQIWSSDFTSITFSRL